MRRVMRLLRWLSAHFATPRLLLEIAAVGIALYGVDQFLASLETRELNTSARHDFDKAQLLLQQGQLPEAIELFRHAHVEDRENRTFALGLTDAFLVDHQPERAQSQLEEMLAADSNDAEANLRMARVESEEGDPTRADSYYHRAIYGVWHTRSAVDIARDRTAARMELVEWLAGRHQNRELLSELLLLDESARTDPAIQAKLPGLYIQAGDLNRAEAAYHALMHTSPRDPSIYAGLGDVEMSRGNFRAARDAFEHARRLDPDNETFKQKASVADGALNLDPTARHLAASDKLTRSTELLNLTVAAAQNCATVDPQLVQSATALLRGNPAARARHGTSGNALSNAASDSSSDPSESRLESAENIWHQMPPNCAPPDDAAVLAAVMHKVAQ